MLRDCASARSCVNLADTQQMQTRGGVRGPCFTRGTRMQRLRNADVCESPALAWNADTEAPN
eukprot:7607087-Alexandrium_andersonii.AAC.1